MDMMVVPLKDLILDPHQDVDLTALPEAEAIELIRKTYRFLPPHAEVSIQDGIVTIRVPDQDEPHLNEALKWYRHAVKHAQMGEYRRAIQLHNLAMAYLEAGDVEKAKDHLIQVLQLNPKDAWAYLILGNIYGKNEAGWNQAERFYRRAFELDPNDAMLLTNYGALMAKQRNFEQAEEFFERAVKAKPDFPNSYLALAMLDMQSAKAQQALAVLDDLFTKTRPMDVRSTPAYAEARRLYLEVARRVADETYDTARAFLRERTQELELETGHSIKVVEYNSLDVRAVSELAWRHGRSEHRIRHKLAERAILPHLLAHELEHIDAEDEARRAGRVKTFKWTPETQAIGMKAISDHPFKLRSAGIPESKIPNLMYQYVHGITYQVYNSPLDMVLEYRLHANDTPVRASQFAWLYAQHLETLQVFTTPEIKRLSPPRIYKANLALNCAFDLFVDSLYAGRTDYASAYRNSEVLPIAQKLFATWQAAMPNLKPGDEYAIVDEFARILKLEGWYEWGTDEEMPPELTELEVSEPSPQGATNPDLLKEKSSAAVMYLHGALKRFAGMTDAQVRAVGKEIAMRGIEGIDYASPESQYIVAAFPGETFTGLQMLCMMYVAFKRTEPSLDLQLDFQDEYETALKMFQQEQ